MVVADLKKPKGFKTLARVYSCAWMDNNNNNTKGTRGEVALAAVLARLETFLAKSGETSAAKKIGRITPR